MFSREDAMCVCVPKMDTLNIIFSNGQQKILIWTKMNIISSFKCQLRISWFVWNNAEGPNVCLTRWSEYEKQVEVVILNQFEKNFHFYSFLWTVSSCSRPNLNVLNASEVNLG